MSHTPGPWTTLCDGCTSTIVAEENVVADLVTQDDDAFLIAAAPGLLAALKLAEGHLEEMRQDKRWHPIEHCPVLDQVRAAIAQAEGRS